MQSSREKSAVHEDHEDEHECIPRGKDVMYTSTEHEAAGKKSKDDYIAELEAELQSFRGARKKASTIRV